jgi:hypothetical protein
VAIPGMNPAQVYIDDWIYSSLRARGYSDRQIFSVPGTVDDREATRQGQIMQQAAREDPRVARAINLIQGQSQSIPFLKGNVPYLDDYIFRALLNMGMSAQQISQLPFVGYSALMAATLRTGQLPPTNIPPAVRQDPRVQRLITLAQSKGILEQTTPLGPANERLKSLLGSMGLGTLLKPATTMLEQGYDVEQILLRLEDTKEFKSRFPAIDQLRARAAKGERVHIPSPAEYLDYEQTAHDLWRRAGLPRNLLSNARITELLGGQVSVVELSERINEVYRAVLAAPADVRNAFAQQFGTADAPHALAALIADPDNALPILEQGLLRAQVSGTAQRFGFTGLEGSTVEQISRLGMSPLGLSQQFSEANRLRPLSSLPGANVSTGGLVTGIFGLSGTSENAINRALSQARAAFSSTGGGAVIGRQGLAGTRSR